MSQFYPEIAWTIFEFKVPPLNIFAGSRSIAVIVHAFVQ